MTEEIKKESGSLNEQEATGIDVKKKVSRSKLLILILLLVLLLLLIFHVITGTSLIPESSKIGFLPPELQPAKAPTGEIYLTLSPLGEQKPNIYKLDVETMALEEYFPDSEYRNYMAKFSPDGSRMAFVRGHYEDDTSQILLLDVETQDLTEITERSEFFLRNPQFSPDGMSVIYWVNELGSSASPRPEDNSIYIADLEGSVEKVSQGAFPIFSPDGKFLLVLKNDGLNTINLHDKESVSVFDMNLKELEDLLVENEVSLSLPSWLTFRYNISPSSNLLILTSALGSSGAIFEITNWDPFLYESVSRLYAYGPNWPVFSPDGKYLVMQGFNQDAEESSLVTIFDVVESSIIQSLDISNYEANYIWVTDWLVR